MREISEQRKNRLRYLKSKLKKLDSEADVAYSRFISSSHKNSGVWLTKVGTIREKMEMVKYQIKHLEGVIVNGTNVRKG